MTSIEQAESVWHADDCGGTCDGCGHIASDGFWYNAPCPDDFSGYQIEWAENGAAPHMTSSEGEK